MSQTALADKAIFMSMSLCKLDWRDRSSLSSLHPGSTTLRASNLTSLMASKLLALLPTISSTPLPLPSWAKVQSVSSRKKSQQNTLGMSKSEGAKSYTCQQHSANDSENVSLGPEPAARPDPQLTVPSLAYAGSRPPSIVSDIEAQESRKAKAPRKFRNFLSNTKPLIKSRTLWAALGASIVLLLLIVVPFSIWKWGQR